MSKVRHIDLSTPQWPCGDSDLFIQLLQVLANHCDGAIVLADEIIAERCVATADEAKGQADTQLCQSISVIPISLGRKRKTTSINSPKPMTTIGALQ